MSQMKSKFAGTCAACRTRFPAGTLIDYDRRGARGRKASHVDCDGEAGERPIMEITTASGTFYQRAGGRCEDAPCCGCCTF